jgi:hypothetical protein
MSAPRWPDPSKLPRNVYCPAGTAGKINAPVASVVVAGASSSIARSSNPEGTRRIDVIDAGPAGEMRMPDTRALGTGCSCRSIAVRSSPDASVMTAACAGAVADGWNVVG